jgi:lipopolysaccharide export system permease protein
MRRRSYALVYAYVGREFALSFGVIFIFFFLIFFLNQLLYMAEQLLQLHVGFADVIRLLIYASPAIIALCVPFSSLVASLMTLGRLSSDNEFTVFQASGVSKRRLFAPFLALAFVASLLSFEVNDVFLPMGTMSFNKLYRSLIMSTPSLELEPYSTKTFNNITFVTGQVDSQAIHDIQIRDTVESSKRRIIMAKTARLRQGEGSEDLISLDLEGVFMFIQDYQRRDRYEFSSSKRMTYNLLIKDITNAIMPIGPREMSSASLYAEILKKRQDLEAARRERDKRVARLLAAAYSGYRAALAENPESRVAYDKSMDSLRASVASAGSMMSESMRDPLLENYELEYQKKFSIPFGALCFVFFSFPVGLSARRSGRAMGFGLGILVSFLYWAMLWGAQTMGARFSGFSAFVMWAPNLAVIAAGALVLLFRGRS